MANNDTPDSPTSDPTMPSRSDERQRHLRTTLINPVEAVRKAIATLENDSYAPRANAASGDVTALPNINAATPWLLQHFFKGEIDLEAELGLRFPSAPMLATFKARHLSNTRQIAALASQDGAAFAHIEADTQSKVVQLTCTVSSMLTLRFNLTDLSALDRRHWLELMRREDGGLAFLWGARRWTRDYLICIRRKYHSSLYAFSPNHFEAAIRMTPTVLASLLDWLDSVWQAPQEAPSSDADLLTW